MNLVYNDDGILEELLNFRCKECGIILPVLSSEEKKFKEKNPACPECHAKNCWELVEEDEE